MAKASFSECPKSPAVIKLQSHSCLLPLGHCSATPPCPLSSCHSPGAVCGLPLYLLSILHLGLFSGLPSSRNSVKGAGSPLPAEFPPSSSLQYLCKGTGQGRWRNRQALREEGGGSPWTTAPSPATSSQGKAPILQPRGAHMLIPRTQTHYLLPAEFPGKTLRRLLLKE